MGKRCLLSKTLNISSKEWSKKPVLIHANMFILAKVQVLQGLVEEKNVEQLILETAETQYKPYKKKYTEMSKLLQNNLSYLKKKNPTPF